MSFFLNDFGLKRVIYDWVRSTSITLWLRYNDTYSGYVLLETAGVNRIK